MVISEAKKQEFKERIAFGFVNSLKEKLVPGHGKDTGYLKANIIFKYFNNQIIVEMPYRAAYLEFGTPPHIIRAKDSGSLHWKSNGKDIFAKLVHHPGTRPYPFIRMTCEKDLKKIIEEAAKKTFR
jgi:hypothetical protein